MKAFAELNEEENGIEVHFKYSREAVDAIKLVPGARFVPAEKGGPHWQIPMDLQAARALRKQFTELQLGDAVKDWGRQVLKHEQKLQSMAIADDWKLSDLKIATKLPEMAQWFRPYQRADVKLLSEMLPGGLNLNEQGLGKTTEILGAIFEADLEDGPHLIIAPKTSLEAVWQYEIERWLPDSHSRCFILNGDIPPADRKKILAEVAKLKEPFWFLTTAAMVRRDAQPDIEWNTVTIDEYHKTGLPEASGSPNKGSQFSQKMKKIKSERRFGLTGTPMAGKPIKIWGGLHYLDGDVFSSKWRWAGHWLVITQDRFGKVIGGIKPGTEDDFYKAHAKYIVRRLKSEVLPQLPPKTHIDVWCNMTKKQKKQYESFARDAEVRIEEYNLNATSILAEYTRLKVFAGAYCDKIEERFRRCPKCKGTGCEFCEQQGRIGYLHPIPSTESGKLPYLVERLAEVGIDADDLQGDAQAVVGTQFVEMAEMVHEYLNDLGIPTELITGGTKGKERTRIQKGFQAGDGTRVVVLNTLAGGVSITLDKADTVHILDETWVPDDQEQLEDRIHRASRMHQVTCYYYRSKGSIEEYIQEVTDEKAFTNKSILDLRRQGFRASLGGKV